MKKRIIIAMLVVLAIATTIGVSKYSYAKKPYYPEPQRNSEIPSHIKWNVTTGEYYNSLDFKWDEKTKKYIAIDMPINNNVASDGEHPFDTWIKEHKNSDDIIDKALMEYYCTPISPEIELKMASFYDPKKDTKLKILTNIGIKNLPKILKRIRSDYAVRSTLMRTAYELTKTSAGNLYASDNDSNLWVLNLVAKAKNSNEIITNAHKKLKFEKNTEAKNKIKKEISSLGIFGLPYAKDESKKGNKEIINIFIEEFGEDFINKDADEICEVIETLKTDF